MNFGGNRMESIQKTLLEKLENEGFKGKVVPIAHLKELGTYLADLHETGIIDKKFYENNISGYKYDYNDQLPMAKSIIIIAMPHSITQLSIKWKGKVHKIIIPPTYVSEEIDNRVYGILEKEMKAAGHNYNRIGTLPLKLLAVRSGLSKYGRNNISYVSGMGSFNRLIAFVTDMPWDQDTWCEPLRMDSCETCHICEAICPTGCIDKERFLIHAEKCLTNLNEYRGDFPEWVDNKWHNSLIGCMECQRLCPQNLEHIKVIQLEDPFEEEEIAAILAKTDINMLSEKTIKTLKELNLLDYYKDNVLSRNLEILLNK